MPVILNFSSERVLSESELEALRHVGRVSQSEQLVVRGRTMRLHHISFMDSFSVEPVSGGLLDRLSAADCWIALVQEGIAFSQKIWRYSLTEAILFCRHSVYIWNRAVQPHVRAKTSVVQYKTKLTLMHLLLVIKTFPVMNNT